MSANQQLLGRLTNEMGKEHGHKSQRTNGLCLGNQALITVLLGRMEAHISKALQLFEWDRTYRAPYTAWGKHGGLLYNDGYSVYVQVKITVILRPYFVLSRIITLSDQAKSKVSAVAGSQPGNLTSA